MNTNRTFWAGLVAVMLLVGSWVWFGQDKPSSHTPLVGVTSGTVLPVASQPTLAVRAQEAVNVTAAVRAPLQMSDLAKQMAEADNLYAWAVQARRQPGAGGHLMANRAIVQCRLAQRGVAHKSPEYYSQEGYQRMLVAYSKLQARCSGFTAADYASVTPEAIARWSKEDRFLALQERLSLQGGQTLEGWKQAVSDWLASPQGELIQSSGTFTPWEDSTAFKVYFDGTWYDNTSWEAVALEGAWLTAACSLGAYCGPGDHLFGMVCMGSGYKCPLRSNEADITEIGFGSAIGMNPDMSVTIAQFRDREARFRTRFLQAVASRDIGVFVPKR